MPKQSEMAEMVAAIQTGGRLMRAAGTGNDEVEQKESSALMEMERSRGNRKNEEKRRDAVNAASLSRVSWCETERDEPHE